MLSTPKDKLVISENISFVVHLISNNYELRELKNKNKLVKADIKSIVKTNKEITKKYKKIGICKKKIKKLKKYEDIYLGYRDIKKLNF